jgi:gluconokinase
VGEHARVTVVVLMGVSGSGKTTIGQCLARDLGWPFYDGDDFRPPANVEKMRRGIALTDADRDPWLDALRQLVASHLRDGRSAIVACSALKQATAFSPSPAIMRPIASPISNL